MPQRALEAERRQLLLLAAGVVACVAVRADELLGGDVPSAQSNVNRLRTSSASWVQALFYGAVDASRLRRRWMSA